MFSNKLSKFVAAAAFGMLLCSTSMASAEQDVLVTGGKTGDYYLYFGPPITTLLQRAWVDVNVQGSAGTPANMDFLVDHQLSYALLQGNVFADLNKDSKYAGKIQIIRGSGIGNESVIAIMNDKIFERSHGSWAAIAAHAKMVRIVTSSKDSGPGRTLQQLMQLDPSGLGKAEPVFMASMDDALNAVADGRADVALLVQFANPNNPRFQLIAEKGLKATPVLSPSMKSLEIPGVGPAFTLCEGAQITSKITINTACTPILLGTGATNDNADLKKVFESVKETDFTPQEPTFARLWKSLLVKSGAAWDTAVTKAGDLAAQVKF